MARGDKEEEMDPQQLKRLQKIKERDLEKLTLDQMNRYFHGDENFIAIFLSSSVLFSVIFLLHISVECIRS